MLRAFVDMLLQELGYVASQIIEFGLIVVILFILVFPVYFVIKKFRLGPSRWHRDTTVAEDILEAVTWRTRPRDYAPSPLALNLLEVGTSLRTVYEWFLGFVLLAATVFVIEFFKNLHDDANRAFLEAYFGIGYVVVFLFTVGQITVIESEKRSRKQTLAKANRLEKRQFKETDAALADAAAYLNMGEPIEMVAGHINPFYSQWSRDRQEAYTRWLRSTLDSVSRRQGRAEDIHIGDLSRLNHQENAPSDQVWSTTKQITLFVMVTIVAFAIFTSILFFIRFPGR
jgi:hypothetical protein